VAACEIFGCAAGEVDESQQKSKTDALKKLTDQSGDPKPEKRPE
jgi:hypothetical protein